MCVCASIHTHVCIQTRDTRVGRGNGHVAAGCVLKTPVGGFSSQECSGDPMATATGGAETLVE